jgi:hypothetical protein
MQLPLHSQIESRLLGKQLGQTSMLPLRYSFLALVMMDAMEVRLTTLSNGWLKTKLQMRLVPSTELVATTMEKNALNN